MGEAFWAADGQLTGSGIGDLKCPQKVVDLKNVRSARVSEMAWRMGEWGMGEWQRAK